MDLFEYQGKQYFARFGIPVSPGGMRAGGLCSATLIVSLVLSRCCACATNAPLAKQAVRTQ